MMSSVDGLEESPSIEGIGRECFCVLVCHTSCGLLPLDLRVVASDYSSMIHDIPFLPPPLEGIAAAQCDDGAPPTIERFGLSLQLYEQGPGVPFAIARSFCVGLV